MQRSELYTRRAADLRPNDPDAQICPATMWLTEQTISTNSLMITRLINLLQQAFDLTFVKPLKPLSNILILPSEGVLLESLHFEPGCERRRILKLQAVAQRLSRESSKPAQTSILCRAKGVIGEHTRR